MAQLHGLVGGGNTVAVVEHDLAAVAGADWLIDLGPGGGDDDGRSWPAGTPEGVTAAPGIRPPATSRPGWRRRPTASEASPRPVEPLAVAPPEVLGLRRR